MKPFLAFLQETSLQRLVRGGATKNTLRPRGNKPVPKTELKRANKEYKEWKAKQERDYEVHSQIMKVAQHLAKQAQRKQQIARALAAYNAGKRK